MAAEEKRKQKEQMKMLKQQVRPALRSAALGRAPKQAFRAGLRVRMRVGPTGISCVVAVGRVCLFRQ